MEKEKTYFTYVFLCLFVHLFIHMHSTHLLSTYYMLGTLIDIGDALSRDGYMWTQIIE